MRPIVSSVVAMGADHEGSGNVHPRTPGSAAIGFLRFLKSKRIAREHEGLGCCPRFAAVVGTSVPFCCAAVSAEAGIARLGFVWKWPGLPSPSDCGPLLGVKLPQWTRGKNGAFDTKAVWPRQASGAFGTIQVASAGELARMD